MKYSLCIEPIFTNYDFYDRIRIAADCGLDAIEFWDPADKDVDKIGTIASNCGLDVAICTTISPWNLRMNSSTEKVLANVEESVKKARAMNCKSLIGLSGDIDSAKNTQKGILINNLNAAKAVCEAEGITLNMEILNSYVDHKGYYLDCSHEGFEIVRCANSKSIKVLFDLYHMQIMEGNLISTIRDNIDKIGHFHSAGVPGRNELYAGETNYPFVISEIDKLGYQGYFGLEYWPTFENKLSLEKTMLYLKGD